MSEREQQLQVVAEATYPHCPSCQQLYVNNQRLRRSLNNVLDRHALDHPTEIQDAAYEAADTLLRTT